MTHYGCCAGIVVTASHNPKEDNGYKVYAQNGCQIVSPMDRDVTLSIQANLEPWSLDVAELMASDRITFANDAVNQHYFQQIRDFHYRSDQENGTSPLRVLPSCCLFVLIVQITYTAMHGVGTPSILKAFETFGLVRPILVKEQCGTLVSCSCLPLLPTHALH